MRASRSARWVSCPREATLAASPTPELWLAVNAEPITSVDVTAADMVDEFDAALHAAGIDLRFAELKVTVKDKVKRFGLLSGLSEERFLATVGEAVSSFLKAHAVARVDWEARPL